MKIVSPILIFFIFGCSSQISENKKQDFQKYDQLVWSAMLQFRKKEYQKSLENFRKALNVLPNESGNDYFFAAASALQLDKPIVAKELIVQSIIHTSTNKEYFLHFYHFNAFRGHRIFSEIEKNYDHYIAEFYKNLKYPKIYLEVDSLVKVDQHDRMHESDLSIIARHDSLNIERLVEITKEYGWFENGWILLWHQRSTYGESNYVWDFFKPFIDRQIEKGIIRKEIWARYEEQRSVTLYGKQIYGFYSTQFDEYPVVDVENLDKRRAKFGLPPFWYLHEVYDKPVPEGYKRK